jgi:hypothetical protein
MVACAQVPISEASALCRRPWMRSALHDWVRKQGWEACTGESAGAHPAA